MDPVERLADAAAERSDAPRWAIRAAAKIVLRGVAARRRDFEHQHLRDCVEIAGGIAAAAAIDASSESAQSRPLLASSPLTVVSFGERLRQVAPWVVETRRRYFDSDEPPFIGSAAAVNWLLAKARETRDATHGVEEAAELDEMRERFAELADRFWILRGHDLPGPAEPFGLDFRGPDGKRHHLRVGGLDALAPLAEASAGIARYLGTDQSQAVGLILTGRAPRSVRGSIEVVPVNVRSPSGWLKRSEVVLRLLSPVQRDESARVLAAIHDVWARRRPVEGRITDRDLALYNIISELGGVDRDEQPFGFWSDVQQRWQAEGHGTITSNALLKRWQRLRRKLRNED